MISNLYCIHLHDLSFYGFHGIHEEEKVVGGWFNVSVDIMSSKIETVNTIADTINYVDAFQIIKKIMQEPTPLLESLVESISNQLFQADHRITEIKITIQKLNPPIQGFAGNVGVTLHKKICR